MADAMPLLVPDWENIGVHITNPDDLIIGQDYWVIDKEFGRIPRPPGILINYGTLSIKEEPNSRGRISLRFENTQQFSNDRVVQDNNNFWTTFENDNFYAVAIPWYLQNGPHHQRKSRTRKFRKNTRTRRLKKHRIC
jgi:hypothetical protein